MVKRGASYEQAVYEFVASELAGGGLPFDAPQSTLTLHPKYYSNDRKSDIVFDVALEVRRYRESSPFFIWIFECKEGSRKVPVDDVEEFHAKMQQISAHKGTIFSPAGFARGVLAYAESKRIGLIRFLPPGSIIHVLEDSYVPTVEEWMMGGEVDDTYDFGGMSSRGVFTPLFLSLLKYEFE